MKGFIIGFTLAVSMWTAAFVGADLITGVNDRPVPACEEDAVLVGEGQFVNGRWDRYACGPSVDDYVVEAPEPCELFNDDTHIVWECAGQQFGVYRIDGVWTPAYYPGE